MTALRAGFACATLTVGLAMASPAAGQQPSADSTRARVNRLLESLGRPAGLDSTLLVDDSVLQAQRNPVSQGPRGSMPAADTIMQRLLGLQGYQVTQYEGASAQFGAGDRELSLRGAADSRARVLRDDFELAADSAIHYDEDRGRIRSEGLAEFSRQGGEPLTTDILIYDLNEQRGTALGAATTYNEGAQWQVAGDLSSVEPGLFWGRHVRFTSCELDEPHYHFSTGEIKWVSDDWFVARNVTLKFADVPVMWLPFIAQGLGDGRSSGLLAPRFSVNDIVRTSRGYERRISNLGFYWAMSEYTDMSLALDWWSNNFIGVNGEFNYNWARQFLRGGINYRQFWRTEGGREVTFNTRHSWEISERMSLRANAAFASSEDFVRRNSFDPRELTQSIDSDGAFTRRFDFGTVNLGAGRKQFLSDDRVEMTLPSLGVSLNPITFFSAPSSRASWYNNITWSGNARFNRRTFDFAEQADSAFTVSMTDRETTDAGVSSSFSIGGFSWSQSATLRDQLNRQIPGFALPFDTLVGPEQGRFDVATSEFSWNTSLSYQQRLVGSMTLTPNVSLRGSALKSDTIDVASQIYVAAPSRLSAGASLKMDLYGFFPGFASYERIRHKISPSFSYDYSPEVTPTELQQRVFRGTQAIQATNQVRVTLNNTFEAKLRAPDDTAAAEELAEPDSLTMALDSLLLDPFQVDSLLNDPDRMARLGLDSIMVDSMRTEAALRGLGGDTPRQAQQQRVVTLLGISTSAVNYDLVRADSTGRFVDGFQTTRLSNSITSDFLRGLSISMDHDLFEDPQSFGTGVGDTDGEAVTARAFKPHLSQLNLGFSLSNRSTLVQWLTNALRGGEATADSIPAEDDEDRGFGNDPLGDAADSDEATIIPRSNDPFGRLGVGAGRGEALVGTWSANFNYSLNRPRQDNVEKTQLLTANIRLQPTARWGVSWRTSYDLETNGFLDHMIRLTRDLHRWEAHFDLRQTITGNWQFRFEVALQDNRDLKFDYEQRNQNRSF